MDWKIKSSKTVLEAHVFSVEELALERPNVQGDQQHLWHRLRCPDWINILPVTSDNRVLLIEQPRVGTFQTTLETPGGMIEADEQRDPMMAAVRELEEETGFTTQRVLPLGHFAANPALQTNRCHFFLGLNCVPNPNRRHFPDANEEIKPRLYAIDEVSELVQLGRIDHVFAVLCIQLALPLLAKLQGK